MEVFQCCGEFLEKGAWEQVFAVLLDGCSSEDLYFPTSKAYLISYQNNCHPKIISEEFCVIRCVAKYFMVVWPFLTPFNIQVNHAKFGQNLIFSGG